MNKEVHGVFFVIKQVFENKTSWQARFHSLWLKGIAAQIEYDKMIYFDV